MLQDKFGRIHDYLRISITENCNFRCTYCMPIEDYPFVPQKNMMSKEEIITIIRTFAELGIKKLRFTGGEPLMRKDFVEILEAIQDLNLSLHLTTNGLLLGRYLDDFKKLRLTNINISIDSLNQEKFKKLTHRDHLNKVLKNIEAAKQKDFNIRLNAVALKDHIEDEIIDLLEYSGKLNIPIRFIEFMPFSDNNWDLSKTVSKKEILDIIASEYSYQAIDGKPEETSKNFKTEEGYQFGIISTVTEPFCQGCNRLRVTADGKIRNCLFGSEEFDLLVNLRNNKSLFETILLSLRSKHESLGGLKQFNKNINKSNSTNRSMIRIGG